MSRTIKGWHHPVMVDLPDWPFDLSSGWIDSPEDRHGVAELFRYVRYHAGRLWAMEFRDRLYRAVGAPYSYPRVASIRFRGKPLYKGD